MNQRNLIPEVRGGVFVSEDQSTVGMNRPFRVKFTSYDGSKYYAWTEQTFDSTGAFVDLDGGRSGTTVNSPAFSPNGATLTLPSYGYVRRAYFDSVLDWVYEITGFGGGGGGGGGGSLTVETDDTLTVISSVSTLEVGHWDFTLSSPGAGQALVKNRFSGCMLKKTTNQSIPNYAGTSTGVTWDSSVYDTDSYFSGAGGAIVTFPVTGVYLVSVYLLWGVSSAGTVRQIYFVMSGNSGLPSPAYSDTRVPVTTALTSTPVWITMVEKFTASSTLTVQCLQDSGGSLNLAPGLLTATRIVGG